MLLIATMTTANAQSEADMKKWAAYMTPTDAHKKMASSDGEWTGDITMWMAPGANPTKNTGTVVNKMIMGGRYQQSTFSGVWDGMEFEGQSTLAYDNAKKMYISTWIDNMGTGMMIMEGKYDPATKAIHMKGKMVDPISGKELKVREVFREIDNDTHIMEMYCQGPDGKEYKNMEIVYTRKK